MTDQSDKWSIYEIQEVCDEIVKDLSDRRYSFLDQLEEWGDDPNHEEHINAVYQFVSKYLEWSTRSDRTREWRSEMFGIIIDQSADVFDSLTEFIESKVFGNDHFEIIWFADFRGSKSTNMLYGREIVFPASSKEAYPVVYCYPEALHGLDEVFNVMVRYEECQNQ